MKSRDVMSKIRFCPHCRAQVQNEATFCYFCGGSLPKRSPAKSFFIALLKCLGYYGFFFIVRELISIVFLIFVAVSRALTDGAALDPEALLEALMQYQAEIGIISTGIIVLGYSLFFRIIKKRFACEIRLKRVSAGGALSSVVFGVACLFTVSVGLAFLYSIFPDLANHSNSDELTEMMESGNLFLTVLNVTVFTGIVEEVLFRGLIYNTLKKAAPRGAAILASAVIFGLAHMNIEQFFYTALLGALLCLVYDRFDSIIAPIILHATFNGSNYLLGALNFKYDIVYIALMLVSAALIMIFAGMVFFTEKVPAKRVQRN